MTLGIGSVRDVIDPSAELIKDSSASEEMERIMNAYCPECETELDQNTGICPACRWDPIVVAKAIQPEPQDAEMSLTERYRGTQYDITLQQAAFSDATSMSRGRTFVIVALVAGGALYGLTMGAMGLF